MFIAGVKDYDKNGEEVKTGLFAGKVTTAGEIKTSQSGKQYATAGVKLGNRQNGDAVWCTIKSFGDFVDAIGSLQKGDTVLVAGRMSTHSYNDKTYTDLVADFLLPGSFAQTPASAVGSAPKQDFVEIGDSEDSLPF